MITDVVHKHLVSTNIVSHIVRRFDEGLKPDYELTGDAELDTHTADTDSVLLEIKAVLAEEEARQERMREAEEDD